MGDRSFASQKLRTPPWGSVTLLEEGDRYRINRIELKPGHFISTQMHHHRSEHWVVVSGTARVICDNEVIFLMPRQSTDVPMNTRHRVENPGVVDLVMIEIQNGEFLGNEQLPQAARALPVRVSVGKNCGAVDGVQHPGGRQTSNVLPQNIALGSLRKTTILI